MRCVSAWLAAIWVANAHAQYLYSLGGQIGSNSITSICNETFNDANSVCSLNAPVPFDIMLIIDPRLDTSKFNLTSHNCHNKTSRTITPATLFPWKSASPLQSTQVV